MGYENFIPLGYIRMKRNGYGISEVEAYRKKLSKRWFQRYIRIKKVQQNASDPIPCSILTTLSFSRTAILSPSVPPMKFLTAGRQMYRALSPETAEFIDFMFRNELFLMYLPKREKRLADTAPIFPARKARSSFFQLQRHCRG